MTLTNCLLFSLAVLAATASPGPNVLIVMLHSLKYGWLNSLVTISGNLSGLLILTAIAAFGVGTLLTVFHEYVFYFKVIGACYLIYLGMRIVLDSMRMKTLFDVGSVGNDHQSPPRARMFREAFLCTITNPKTLIFQSSIFPQFIDIDQPIVGQFLIMYLIIVATVATVHIGYANAAAWASVKLKSDGIRRKISMASGGCFILFGLLLAPLR